MRAEAISRLSARQQRRILAQAQRKEDAQQLAAQTIHGLLECGQRIDLKEVAEAIRLTVSRSGSGFLS
jgi:hypothetical protein